MVSLKKIKKYINSELLIWSVFLSIGFFSTFIIPLCAYIKRDYFSYTNAWDEETYLSFQGALCTKLVGLRWFSGLFVWLIHKCGISGAQLNLGLDIVTPLILILTIYKISLKISGSHVKSLRMAWFSYFGTVLFNQANPALLNLFPNWRYEETIWVVAWESYLPFIRSPEPQISLLLISCAILFFIKSPSHWWILIAPVPFLYYSVAVFYLFFLSVYLLNKFLKILLPKLQNGFKRSVLLNVVVFIGLASGFFLFKETALAYNKSEYNLIKLGHSIRISPLLIWTTCSLILSFFVGAKNLNYNNKQKILLFGITCIGIQMFISNQQIISGIEIHPQGLQAFPGTFVAAISLGLLNEALVFKYVSIIKKWLVACLQLILSMAILYCLHVSQGLDIKNKKYKIFVNHNISQYDLCLIREHPLSVIVPSSYLAGRILLAFPGQIAPPFAYQYLYPWFLNKDPKVKKKILDAFTYVNNHSKNPDIAPWYQEIKNIEINMKKQLVKTNSDSALWTTQKNHEEKWIIISCDADIFLDIWPKK